MSSFWTPDGEHQVAEPETELVDTPDSRAAMNSREPNNDGAAMDPDAAAAVEAELEAAQQQLLSVPAEQIVGNHVIGLFELAALHLRVADPDLEQARIAIDAMGLLVENLGPQLPDHETLIMALQQIRMAYVEVHGALETPEED